MSTTCNPNDPRLGKGGDKDPKPQNEIYLVDCAETPFVRPYRDSYKHTVCGTVTRMGSALSETYAKNPNFYGYTYCCNCSKHLPVSEFTWTADGTVVGS